jgi:hypothetical protein
LTHPTRIAVALLLLGLVGCPEPVPTNEGGAISPGEPGANLGQQTGGAPPSSGMTNPEGSAGAMPAAGTIMGEVPDSERTPKFTQEQLAASGSTIKGTVTCADCEGQILIRVLPPPPESPSGAVEVIELLTLAVFPSAGPFELKVPSDRERVILQVVDDANKDGQPSVGERMGLPLTGATEVKSLVEGVELTVGVFPEMPAKDAAGQPLTGSQGSATGSTIPTAPEGQVTPPTPGGGTTAPATGGPTTPTTPATGGPTTPATGGPTTPATGGPTTPTAAPK